MVDRFRPRLTAEGFTLIEMMFVVVIVGLLAMIAIANFSSQARNARIGRTAAELRSLSTAFVAYQAEHGELPNDSHDALPAGMDQYIAPSVWANGTPLGGSYSWQGPSGHGIAALSISGSDEDLEAFEILDRMLDDGDLGVGRFRTLDGRPTWILFEAP